MTEQFANTAQTTLNGGISSGVTSLTVTSATLFPGSGTFRLLIDSEILIVTGVAGAIFTITRGAESTAAAAHSNGATVTAIVTAGAIAQLKTDVSGGTFIAPTGTGFVTVTAGALDVASRAVGANIYTFLATPSGANLAAALTSALPVSKGGTGLTALTIPASGLLVGTTDTQTLTGKTIGGQLQGAAVAMGASAIDWTLGTVFTKTLAAGANTFTFSNQASGMVITVRVTGAASTLTWPTVKWAGGAAPTQTASGIDVYTFVHDGTSVYGSVVQAMA